MTFWQAVLVVVAGLGAGTINTVVGSGTLITFPTLLAACVDEFSENEDLPNTTNPDDWARISGKKGERIVYVRTLVGGSSKDFGRAIEQVNTGQYL